MAGKEPAVKFQVTRPNIESSNNHSGNDGDGTEREPLAPKTTADSEHPMVLFTEDTGEVPTIGSFLEQVAGYRGGMAPTSAETKESAEPERAKLGTLLGVYLPCIQNIFGVLLFIRMAWIVGTAGVLQAFFIVFMSCCTTFLTSISLSAIATNGIVPGGGSYFMISRSLGPEFGGAVGILFYLGTSFAGAMYIMGAVEILLTYIAPQMAFGGDFQDNAVRANNVRAYGTCLLLILACCVFIGVRFVSIVAAISLACVILSIFALYIGIFATKQDDQVMVCALGDRLLNRDVWTLDGVEYCTKNATASVGNVTLNLPLYQKYCSNGTCLDYFVSSDVRYYDGIPGIASGVFVDNFESTYGEKGKLYGEDVSGSASRGEIVADITTSFMVLLAIYFPSCTGIMAGSNRSGDLQDAQKSIPIGTIAATLTTSFVYISVVFLFGATIDGALLRDKFGVSLGQGGMVTASMAWPHRWVLLIGSFLSTVGAGLQSLTGAPRLLQAIAKDEVIPIIRKLSYMTKRGEPVFAILVTVTLCEIGVLSGNLDILNPIITMFFLMCYAFVNFAVVLQSLMKAPGWRPRFRFYHWSLSMLGMLMCVALMFISSWWAALVAIVLAIAIYKYIEYKGAEQEWGDGFRGLAMSAARYALLKLQEGHPHTKNWRPQLLMLVKVDSELQPAHPKLLSFCAQLKAGKGLSLVATVLEGDYNDEMHQKCSVAKQNLMKAMETCKVKGFVDVSAASNVKEGLCNFVQVCGLGGLRHNTVVLGWPYDWHKDVDTEKTAYFIDTVRYVQTSQNCLLITRNINNFPESNEKLEGNIDIWWIVHDGGLLVLLPYLLTKHKTWSKCKMRIFAVAQMSDNSIKMKESLQSWLYHLRIRADVEVVEMADKDVSAYVFERTVLMEERARFLKQIKIDKQNINKEPQHIVDEIHRRSSVPGAGGAGYPPQADELEKIPEEGGVEEGATTNNQTLDLQQYTFSPQAAAELKKRYLQGGTKPTEMKSKNLQSSPDDANVRRMHTAVHLNQIIHEKSSKAQLVVLNLPPIPKRRAADLNYVEYLEVLSDGLNRVVMVRGSGREVVTAYS